MSLFLTVAAVTIIFVLWCAIFLYCVSQADKRIHEEYDRKIEKWRQRK